MGAESPSAFSLKNSYVVDIDIDLTKKVTASSQNHPNADDAMNEAYYNCILSNNIDIVVDPIYKRTNIEYPLLKLLIPNKYRYEIHGFAGYYKNPETKIDWENKREKYAAAQELAMEQAKLKKTKVEMQIEKEVFDLRGTNLNYLSKIDPSARETKSSYLIESEKGCCPGNSNNVVVNSNSSGSGFGNVHLLHTTDNKTSLVEEYNKLLGSSNYKDGSKPEVRNFKTGSSKKERKNNSLKSGFFKFLRR